MLIGIQSGILPVSLLTAIGYNQSYYAAESRHAHLTPSGALHRTMPLGTGRGS